MAVVPLLYLLLAAPLLGARATLLHPLSTAVQGPNGLAAATLADNG